MTEKIRFHFEGALADDHRMNFYEAARFQYAAARMMVKLLQFRSHGRFVKKITSGSNFEVDLVSQSDGSFNMDIVIPNQSKDDRQFVKLPVADLLAYVSERVVAKSAGGGIDSDGKPPSEGRQSDTVSHETVDRLVRAARLGQDVPEGLSGEVVDLFKRRLAEASREQTLLENSDAIARIDAVRSQKLIGMAAPLISEMATALRTSANTLEVVSVSKGESNPILFLDKQMASEIETAIVDSEITLILGDVAQFNKETGWGKLKIENGTKVINFNIPYDMLAFMKKKLIHSMNVDMVYLQTYAVRDRGGELTRFIVVGLLPTPIA